MVELGVDSALVRGSAVRQKAVCSEAAGYGYRQELQDFQTRVDDTRTGRLRRSHMRLVSFEDINGRQTFVNADRVNHVSDFGSGTTEINFGNKEATVYVTMEVSLVASTLLKAGKP